MPETKTITNPSLYRDLDKPFESPASANVAVQAFWDDVYALREKHRIPDILMVMRVPLDEGDSFVMMTAGNQLYAESMAAFGFGQATADRQQMISRVLDRHIKARRDR